MWESLLGDLLLWEPDFEFLSAGPGNSDSIFCRQFEGCLQRFHLIPAETLLAYSES